MSFFSGISDAQSSRGNALYYLPGRYRVRVIAHRQGEQFKSGDGFFVAEHEIVTSDNAQRPPGCVVSFFVSVPCDTRGVANLARRQYALADIKAYLEALTGQEIDDQSAAACVGEDNPCEGLEVDVIVREVPAKAKTVGEPPRVYTRFSWVKV